MKIQGIVIMGVAGCGKSSVGSALAQMLGARLIEGDDYHSETNREKMSRGIPLTDADRAGWLDDLGRILGESGYRVLTCSALKKTYRDRLRAAAPGLRFVFLRIGLEEARRRVAARAAEHFFSVSLVDSQFATLESPESERDVLTVDARDSISHIVNRAFAWLSTEVTA